MHEAHANPGRPRFDSQHPIWVYPVHTNEIQAIQVGKYHGYGRDESSMKGVDYALKRQ